jgi:two-component system, NarL family, nitrate/nitrite response regulator NarL
MVVDPIQVLVLADVRLYREGLADVLRRNGIGSVATAHTVDAAVETLRREPCRIVLVGLSGGDTIAACVSVARACPDARVVALAVRDTRDILAAVEAGVAGYVPGEASLEELIGTIHSVARGEMPCSPEVAAVLCRRLAQLAPLGEPAFRAPGLTAREQEVFALVGERLSNKEIASQLCIEVTTVKNHVHNVLEKLHVHRRDDAVAVLHRMGAH